MEHTILLIQTNEDTNSRHFMPFESPKLAMEALCDLYQDKVRNEMKNETPLKWKLSGMFQFIDELPDLGCIVLAANNKHYIPYGKDWIKERLLIFLRNQFCSE